MAPDPRLESIEAISHRLNLIRRAYSAAQGHSHEMSQVEFANLVGMSKQAWNNAETGDHRIGLDNAMSIVRRIGVTLDYIYLGNQDLLPHAIAVEIEKLDRYKATKRA